MVKELIAVKINGSCFLAHLSCSRYMIKWSMLLRRFDTHGACISTAAYSTEGLNQIAGAKEAKSILQASLTVLIKPTINSRIIPESGLDGASGSFLCDGIREWIRQAINTPSAKKQMEGTTDGIRRSSEIR